MQITRLTHTIWPPRQCKICATRIEANQPRHLLSHGNHHPVTLCETCGQAFATESHPTHLRKYLDLFPQTRPQ